MEHELTQAKRTLQIGYVVALIFTIISFWLAPEILSGRQGLSYFGTIPRTVWLYTFAIGTIFTSYLWTAFTLRGASRQRCVRLSLVILPFLFIGLLLTPYTKSDAIWRVHAWFGRSLFLIQFGLTAWLALKHRMRVIIPYLAIELITGGLLLLWLGEVVAYGSQLQLLFQIAFAVMLIEALTAPTSPKGNPWFVNLEKTNNLS